MKNNKVMDLFSGCGGFSAGFLNSGYDVVCAVEYDKNIANTYKKNHLRTKMIVDDIRNIEKKNI